MTEIDLANKTDREILVLLVQCVNGVNERLDTQNGRVRKLEDWRNGIVGALGILSLLFVAVVVPVAIKVML